MSKATSRRKYFVRPELQGKYILSNLVIALLGSIAFALLTAFFSAGTKVFVYRDYTLQMGSPGSIFLRELASAQLFYIVAVGILVIFLSIITSHRLAGPMVKMERALGAMAGGDYSGHVALRRKDVGKDLAEKINAVSVNLAERMGTMDILLKKMEERLAAEGSVNGNKEMDELVSQLRTELSYFTFPEIPPE